MCANFRVKRTFFTFSAQILPKNQYYGRNLKNISLDSESAPRRYHVPIFSQKGQLWIFQLKFGKIAQIHAIF